MRFQQFFLYKTVSTSGKEICNARILQYPNKHIKVACRLHCCCDGTPIGTEAGASLFHLPTRQLSNWLNERQTILICETLHGVDASPRKKKWKLPYSKVRVVDLLNIFQDCFIGIGVITWLPQRQWNDPGECGWIIYMITRRWYFT